MDSGIGIHPECKAAIFEPFAQFDDSSDAGRQGLGLGLPIVKGIVDLHGGQISVASDGEKCGSVFCVRLPIQDEPACDCASGREDDAPGQRPLRILVIDDSHDLADTICSLLGILGHVTEAAYSGPEGIARAAAMNPDAILCDIGLPDMDGYEVARQVRSNPATRHIYLIALSGFAQQEDIEQAMQAGFDQHIAKPVNIDFIQTILTRSISDARQPIAMMQSVDPARMHGKPASGSSV